MTGELGSPLRWSGLMRASVRPLPGSPGRSRQSRRWQHRDIFPRGRVTPRRRQRGSGDPQLPAPPSSSLGDIPPGEPGEPGPLPLGDGWSRCRAFGKPQGPGSPCASAGAPQTPTSVGRGCCPDPPSPPGCANPELELRTAGPLLAGRSRGPARRGPRMGGGCRRQGLAPPGGPCSTGSSPTEPAPCVPLGNTPPCEPCRVRWGTNHWRRRPCIWGGLPCGWDPQLQKPPWLPREGRCVTKAEKRSSCVLLTAARRGNRENQRPPPPSPSRRAAADSLRGWAQWGAGVG